MRDWQEIDKELKAAFESGAILKADRAQLDSWLIALTGKTYQLMLDQTPLLQRLEVVTHLAKVRLDEESLTRRDEQAVKASESSRRQHRWSLGIAVTSIVMTLLLAIADRVWPPLKSQPQPASAQPIPSTLPPTPLPVDPSPVATSPSSTLLTVPAVPEL
jgi:hypothetical protein